MGMRRVRRFWDRRRRSEELVGAVFVLRVVIGRSLM
jgi:hypothetical protein